MEEDLDLGIDKIETKKIPKTHKEKTSFIEKSSIFLIVLVAAFILFNQIQLMQISSALGGTSYSSAGVKLVSGQAVFEVKKTGNDAQDVINALVPKGTPSYGAELAVSFDDPVNSLTKLAKLHRSVSTDSLSAEEKTRYINVGTKISCEFCCSAPSVVDSHGRDLCGCSHAQSFMGLSKYLIKNHPEMTDEQILAELTKWKTLYYPKNMVQKGVALLQNDQPLTAEALNDRNLLKKLSTGDLGSIGELPEMVGGC